MNIAVIAADGRSGRAFVAAALAAGHTVRAGVRKQSVFSLHSQLTVVPCDATNASNVKNLISGCDVVASFIGHVKGSPALVQTEAMQTIIMVMDEMGIKRIVSLTGTGVRCKGDIISIVDRLLNACIRLVDPARVNDGKRHFIVLQNSATRWTVIRVLKLTNHKPKPFMLREHGPAAILTSRYDVAEAVLQVIEHDTFIRQAPIVGA